MSQIIEVGDVIARYRLVIGEAQQNARALTQTIQQEAAKAETTTKGAKRALDDLGRSKGPKAIAAEIAAATRRTHEFAVALRAATTAELDMAAAQERIAAAARSIQFQRMMTLAKPIIREQASTAIDDIKRPSVSSGHTLDLTTGNIVTMQQRATALQAALQRAGSVTFGKLHAEFVSLERLAAALRRQMVAVGAAGSEAFEALKIQLDAVERRMLLLKETARSTGRELKTSAEQAATRTEALRSGLQAASNALLSMGTGMAAVIGAGVIVAGKVQQASIAFENLTGSVAASKELMAELATYANATGQKIFDVYRSAQLLMNSGVKAGEVTQALRGISGAAIRSGRGDEAFLRIAMAISQIQSKGRVMGEEMTQQLGELFDAWGVLARQMGMTREEVQKLAQAGKLTADIAVPALLTGMNEEFGKLADRNPETIVGKWNILLNKFVTLATENADTLLEVGEAAIKVLGAVAKIIEKIGPETFVWTTAILLGLGALGKSGGALWGLKDLLKDIGLLARLAPALQGITGAAGAAVRGIGGITVALRGLAAAGPWAALIAASAALVYEVGGIFWYRNEAKKAEAEGKRLEALGKAAYEKNLARLKALDAAAKGEGYRSFADLQRKAEAGDATAIPIYRKVVLDTTGTETKLDLKAKAETATVPLNLVADYPAMRAEVKQLEEWARQYKVLIALNPDNEELQQHLKAVEDRVSALKTALAATDAQQVQQIETQGAWLKRQQEAEIKRLQLTDERLALEDDLRTATEESERRRIRYAMQRNALEADTARDATMAKERYAQALLNAQSGAERAAIETRQDLEMRAIDATHDRRMKALEREEKKAEQAENRRSTLQEAWFSIVNADSNYRSGFAAAGGTPFTAYTAAAALPGGTQVPLPMISSNGYVPVPRLAGGHPLAGGKLEVVVYVDDNGALDAKINGAINAHATVVRRRAGQGA